MRHKGMRVPLARIQPVRMPADEVIDAEVEDVTPGPGAAAKSGDGTPRARPQKAKATKRPGSVEREFMPAALEILETPASPAGRLIMMTIVAGLIAAVAWSYLSKVDVVVTAPGRVVPIGGTKLVQAQEIGTVRAIHVADGQHVEAGEVLVELDATDSEVDIDQLLLQRNDAALEAARLDAFIKAVNGKPFEFQPEPEDLDPALVAMNRNRLASDLASFQARLGAYRAERDLQMASIEKVRAEVDKLTEMKPLVVSREANIRYLMEQGHAPQSVWQQVKAQLVDVTHDLIIKSHQITEAENSLQSVEKQIEGLSASTLQTAYQKLLESKELFARADLALRKATKREDLQTLRASVAGTVQNLTIHTIGGVVRPADALMVIVPDNARLEVRAQVLNRDKGVVVEGKDAEIKFEAFDFTRYGTIKGKVLSVSNDAFKSEDLGLVYEARISLDRNTIEVERETVAITPGMMVLAEIKTGNRRIIDFLLSPLMRYRDEAIRER